MFFFIGSYTDTQNPFGLSVCSFDGNEITILNSIAVENASYIALSENRKNVYVVNENHTEEDKVTAFIFDDQNKQLTCINSVPSNGADPCYLSLSRTGAMAFVSNYSGGSLSVLNIDQLTGGVSNIQTLIHEVPKINSGILRSHIHSAITSPDGKFLLVADLGLDSIMVYKFDENNIREPLISDFHSLIKFSTGTGPRHILFSNDGCLLYVVGELDGSVHVLSWDSGQLSIIQSLKLMSEDYDERNSAADIQITPNGDFLYVSNRGDANQIIAFKIDKAFGTLRIIDRFSTGGIGPRNFAIDSDGKFMLVAHQNSHDVRVFQINNITGSINDVGLVLKINSPVCIKFI